MSRFDFFHSRRTSFRSEIWEYQGLPVQLVLRARRRSVCIELKPDAPVTVRGNMSLTARQAEKYLAEKWHWVENQWRQLQARPKIQLLNGDYIKILGETFSIERQLSRVRKPKLGLYASNKIQMLLPVDSDGYLTIQECTKVLKDFYQQEALDFLPTRVLALANEMDLHPQSLRFRWMRSRWGSCSSRGKVCLNSRLMTAPEWVIDCVIVHELAHLRHMNHSRDFWRLVAQFAPRHKDADVWLHDNSN